MSRRSLIIAVLSCCAAIIVAFLLRKVHWSHIAAEFGAIRWENARLKPLVKEAKRRGLTYERLSIECLRGCPQIEVEGSAVLEDSEHEGGGSVTAESPIGAPVVWCIDHPSPGVSYVNGNPQRAVTWKDESPIPINRLKYDRCQWVVAIVRGVRPDRILLEFKGLR